MRLALLRFHLEPNTAANFGSWKTAARELYKATRSNVGAGSLKIKEYENDGSAGTCQICRGMHKGIGMDQAKM